MKQMLFVAALSATLGAVTAILVGRPPPAPRAPDPARGLDAVTLESVLVRVLERAAPAAPPPSPAPQKPAAAAPAEIPAADPAVLESLTEVPEAQRTWLFRPEEEVLRQLGTPDRVEASSGVELWYYQLSSGWRRLDFHRGRLICIH
jgi:hypothetical protein